MEKLNKEDIYINLQGKSEEELTELYWVLKNNNQILSRQKLDDFMSYKNHPRYYVLIYDGYAWNGDSRFNKQEVTIQQLKEILKPMETLEQQLEKAKAEVKRIEKEIEDSKIKLGDWVYCKTNDCIFKYQYGRLEYDLTKITDKELINKLNYLIK